MAFSKEQKNNIVSQYETWLKESKAVFMMEFSNMNMKEIDALRKKVREAGGEAHVVKNTLMNRALKNAGVKLDKKLVGTTLVSFAFEEAPAVAKVFDEAAKSDLFNLKFGFLENSPITAAEIKSLAELPPLPIMRAMLLGTISAPASKLVRTINEPARGLAAVVKAFSEKESVAA